MPSRLQVQIALVDIGLPLDLARLISEYCMYPDRDPFSHAFSHGMRMYYLYC